MFEGLNINIIKAWSGEQEQSLEIVNCLQIKPSTRGFIFIDGHNPSMCDEEQEIQDLWFVLFLCRNIECEYTFVK